MRKLSKYSSVELFPKKLLIINCECWKCYEEMKVAVIKNEESSNSEDNIYGPIKFSENEIKLAQEQGVIIREHFSSTRNERYLASTCDNCKSFVGEFYLFADYYDPAIQGDLKYTIIDLT
jgi:hypothetical protein